MLIAENSLGEKINIARLTKKEIKMLRRGLWYCPGCKEEVVIKQGEVVRPHFAHKRLADCVMFSENESEEHLKGKELIAKNCEAFNISYEIESYLPQLKQRPDVLIGDRIAIEFQCSPLSINRFKERSEAYLEKGYQVIWLVGSRFHLASQLSNLQKQFLYLSAEKGFYFWELDTQQEKINLNYFLIKFSEGLKHKRKSWSLAENSLLTILGHPQKKEMEQIKIQSDVSYRYQLNKWNQGLNQRQPAVMKLQEFFYEKGQNIRELKTYYYYPSFFTPVLMEEELKIRFFVYTYLKENTSGEMSELLDFVKEKVSEDLPVFVLIGEELLLSYCISLYLSFLTQRRMVRYQKGRYYLVETSEKTQDFKSEILWLPLKYVMINK